MEVNMMKYITIEEAAKENYITPEMVACMVVYDSIPCITINGKTMVHPGDVAKVVAKMFEAGKKGMARRVKIRGLFPPERNKE